MAEGNGPPPPPYSSRSGTRGNERGKGRWRGGYKHLSEVVDALEVVAAAACEAAWMTHATQHVGFD